MPMEPVPQASSFVDVGDQVPVAVAVTDATGAAADAGGITLTITLPDGTTTSPAVTHPGVGSYTVTYTPAQAGRYLLRWVATGANAATYTDVLDVAATDPHFVISLAAAREALRKPATDTVDDEKIRLYMGAVTTIVEAACGPQALTTKTVTRDGGRGAILLSTQVVAIVSVTENGQLLTGANDYTVDAEAGILYRGSSSAPTRFYPGHANVTIVWTAGANIVAANVRLAARLILKHLWEADQQSNRPGIGGTATAEGTVTVVGYAIPRRAAELLAPTPTVIPGFA